jgi:hypothetical protein
LIFDGLAAVSILVMMLSCQAGLPKSEVIDWSSESVIFTFHVSLNDGLGSDVACFAAYLVDEHTVPAGSIIPSLGTGTQYKIQYSWKESDKT